MPAPPTPESPDVSAMDAVRDSQDRALEREGIPMYLALVREARPGGPAFPEVDPVAREVAAAVAARLDAHRAQVAPSQRDGDLGVTMTVLAAVAFADFDRSALR